MTCKGQNHSRQSGGHEIDGTTVETLNQTPTEDGFVQNPYPFYETARGRAGALFHWQDYAMPCAVSYGAVWAILRDRRFGRQVPAELAAEKPAHQAAF